MTDYNTTRDVAGTVTAHFERVLRVALRSISEDHQDAMVVVSLKNHYQFCADPDTHEDGIDLDDTILAAIERVLEDYMNQADFNAWMLTRKGTANG